MSDTIENQILAYIEENENAARWQIIKELGLKPSSVDYILKKLIKKGKIKRIFLGIFKVVE